MVVTDLKRCPLALIIALPWSVILLPSSITGSLARTDALRSAKHDSTPCITSELRSGEDDVTPSTTDELRSAEDDSTP